ncbi:hypothetical protein BO70DRAFT_417850 [Aspergillus heteromorphus CBS 117.55]|uniref:F-box domain-containing protein n=1 Tax=Aspergillus heteromorphus CBS 117.55 TaxID=1448321 RepID=A0A317WUI7_9EURO|nr:uncharacterized protein BO70DRAFT_417850 [Aspergillus heteromorphus CBS 117.55]PWY88962.1 hypothetical protein BO70DRAFT_417850 [Aspergillus heteromorphus CBS 117.55]
MHLTDLPPEISILIARLLASHDLFQLVLVSKTCWSRFTPQLYHHVILPLNMWEAAGFERMKNMKLPVRRFTQTLIENPVLAEMIHILELYPSRCEGNKWRGRLPPLKKLQPESYRASMLPYSDANAKSRRKARFNAWKRDLSSHSDRYEDAWVALLLVQLRNLQQLAMEIPEERSFYDASRRLTTNVDRVIHWAQNPRLGILTRLTDVRLRFGPIYQGMGGFEAILIHRLLPYLKIPSLRRFFVCDPIESTTPTTAMAMQLTEKAASLPLTHLRLQPVGEPLTSLPYLLSMFSGLESFTLIQDDHGSQYCRSGNGHHDLLDTSSFYAPLLRFQHSLRNLHITFARDIRIWQAPTLPRPSFLGSLRDFSVLETIRMRWADLVPFDEHGSQGAPLVPLRSLLPPALRSLFIDDCLVHSLTVLCSELGDLAGSLPGGPCPRLERLDIRSAYREQEPGGCLWCSPNPASPVKSVQGADAILEERLIPLKERFREVGVHFRVVAHRTPDTYATLDEQRQQLEEGGIGEHRWLAGDGTDLWRR